MLKLLRGGGRAAFSLAAPQARLRRSRSWPAAAGHITGRTGAWLHCMIMIVTGHGFKISCLSSSHWRLSEFSVAINFSQAARSVVKLQKARPPPFIHLMHGHTRFSGFGPAAGTVSLLSCATGNCFRDSEAAEC